MIKAIKEAIDLINPEQFIIKESEEDDEEEDEDDQEFFDEN